MFGSGPFGSGPFGGSPTASEDPTAVENQGLELPKRRDLPPLPSFALDVEGAGLDEGAFAPSTPGGGVAGHGRAAGEIRGSVDNASGLDAGVGTFEVGANIAATRDHRLQAEPGAYALDSGNVNVVSGVATAAGASAGLADGAHAIGGPHTGVTIEALWAEVRAQRALLEATLRAQPGRPVGLGHNNGPGFLPTPAEDLAETNRFIDLLSDDGPRTSRDVDALVAAAEAAKATAAKGETALSAFAMSVIKGAGLAIGKHVVDELMETSWWSALYARLAALAAAVIDWAAAFAHL